MRAEKAIPLGASSDANAVRKRHHPSFVGVGVQRRLKLRLRLFWRCPTASHARPLSHSLFFLVELTIVVRDLLLGVSVIIIGVEHDGGGSQRGVIGQIAGTSDGAGSVGASPALPQWVPPLPPKTQCARR